MEQKRITRTTMPGVLRKQGEMYYIRVPKEVVERMALSKDEHIDIVIELPTRESRSFQLIPIQHEVIDILLFQSVFHAIAAHFRLAQQVMLVTLVNLNDVHLFQNDRVLHPLLIRE